MALMRDVCPLGKENAQLIVVGRCVDGYAKPLQIITSTTWCRCQPL
jgi:hypothetical protein